MNELVPSKEMIAAPENPTVDDLIAFYSEGNFAKGCSVRIPYRATREVLERLQHELRLAGNRETAFRRANDGLKQALDERTESCEYSDSGTHECKHCDRSWSAPEPLAELPPKLDTTMPTVWHYLLVAAHQVVEAVDFNHANKAEPLKWTVPWAKVTALRDAILKAKMLNGSPGPSQPPGDGWQPIETAPPTDRRNPVYVAYPHFNDGNKTMVPDEYSCFTAYCDDLGWDTGFWRLHEMPHYWHPLPSAPTTKRDGLEIKRHSLTKGESRS